MRLEVVATRPKLPALALGWCRAGGADVATLPRVDGVSTMHGDLVSLQVVNGGEAFRASTARLFAEEGFLVLESVLPVPLSA